MVRSLEHDDGRDRGAPTLRVVSQPAKSANPYLSLLYEALEPYGVEWAGGFVLSPRWLLANRGNVDAIHFHWPERLWNGSSEWGARALLKLRLILGITGALGIKRVWTVHNLEAHESNGWQDRIGQRMLARHCDLLIAHTERTANKVNALLRPRIPVLVMPHGSYAGWYPEPRSERDIRATLGLEGSKPILCCVGRLREYKGLDVACEALAHLNDDVHLVIAGTAHDGFDMGALEHYARTMPNLTLIPRALDDQEFADILSVSDAALLPYRQITGSGVLLAAWTQGCGVIASDLDYFREMLPPGGAAGMVFPEGDAEALADAIRAYLRIPEENRARAISESVEAFSWERCIVPVGDVFSGWQQRGEGASSVPDRLYVQDA